MTSKGQVTIPRSIRERLGMEPGTRLLFRLEPGNRLVVEIARDSQNPSLAGALHQFAKDRPVTLEEMKLAVRRRAADRDERSRKAG